MGHSWKSYPISPLLVFYRNLKWLYLFYTIESPQKWIINIQGNFLLIQNCIRKTLPNITDSVRNEKWIDIKQAEQSHRCQWVQVTIEPWYIVAYRLQMNRYHVFRQKPFPVNWFAVLYLYSKMNYMFWIIF